MGMSVGYIPLSEITNYGLTLGHVEDNLEDFVEIIMEADEGYLEVINKKSPPPTSSPKPSPKGSAKPPPTKR